MSVCVRTFSTEPVAQSRSLLFRKESTAVAVWTLLGDTCLRISCYHYSEGWKLKPRTCSTLRFFFQTIPFICVEVLIAERDEKYCQSLRHTCVLRLIFRFEEVAVERKKSSSRFCLLSLFQTYN